jgi:uncharacterized membrane-anchored protein YhcB (DUF1043 family)
MHTPLTGETAGNLNAGSWYRLGRNGKIIHGLVWVILLLLPVLFSFSNQPDSFARYVREWLPLFSSAVVFYVNYLVLIDRLLFRSEYGSYLLLNFLLIAAITFVTIEGFGFIAEAFGDGRTGNPGRRPPLSMISFRVASSLLLTVGVAIAIKSTRRWQQTERRQKQLEQEHLESELVNLKNQLNPHFFFNTLNNLYALIAIDADKAQDVVHRLSKMMRYLLYDSNEKFVPLGKELEFINHYMDLMDLRLSDHVTVRRNIRVDQPGLPVAPLLFVSLIENAFKHGVSATQHSEVEVDLSLSPDRTLHFAVRNTAFPKETRDLSGSGIGLKNLEKRLQLLYPGRHAFTYGTDGAVFTATLTLQL